MLAGQPNVQLVPTGVPNFTLAEQFRLPGQIRGLHPGLYHSPYYIMPYCTGVPTVVTIYDLIPLVCRGYFSAAQRLAFRLTTALALRSASRVITISAATRCDLLSHFHVPPEKVTSVPLAADEHFYPRPPAEIAQLRAEYGLPEQYVLYLGINKPHKNLVCLVNAWAQIRNSQFAIRNSQLIIAGAWDERYPEPKQRVEMLGLGNAVRFLGPVPDALLPALYSGATLFAFPSQYEGFGLPVLEAMACGTPVACSNTSSLPEVAGDAAITLDPTDIAALANTLSRLLTDANLRADLQERGLRRAAQFSWERTARGTLAVYQQAAD